MDPISRSSCGFLYTATAEVSHQEEKGQGKTFLHFHTATASLTRKVKVGQRGGVCTAFGVCKGGIEAFHAPSDFEVEQVGKKSMELYLELKGYFHSMR